MKVLRIGVFDSGRGGEFIAEGLKKLLPEYDFMVVNDRENVPYGSRIDAEVTDLTDAAIQPLIAAGCPIIVIACNTATLAGIGVLRARYPSVQFVGIEPMIKPASASSKTQRVTVLATPLTLQSARYRQLISEYGNQLVIDEPNAAGWAAAIEAGRLDAISFNEVRESTKNGSDTIILACTHYLALRSRLRKAFPQVTILEPTEAIARRISALLVRQ